MIDTLRPWLRRVRTRLGRARYRRGRGRREGVRLHLGCGAEYWPGYVNVDADPRADSDVCMDFTGVGAAFADASVSEIVMIHSLSYLRLWQARDLFKDLFRLMSQGGKLIIEFPDLAKCARAAIESAGQPEAYLEAVRGLYAFDMSQIVGRAMFTPYAFGWSALHLKGELEHAGFLGVNVCDPQTHERRLWRDSRVEGIR
jgi:hypothetical protein